MSNKNKLCICFQMPIESYAGGISKIVNSYLDHKDDFLKCGYDISLFDYHPQKKINNSKIDNLVYMYLQRKRLCDYIKKNDISILHIHTSREFLFLKDVLLGKTIKKKFRIKTVLTIHVGDVSTVFNRIPCFLRKKLIRYCNKYFDKVIFLSEAIKKQFIERGLKSGKASVLYNFYDFGDISAPQKTFSYDKEVLELTFIGMINKDKGIIELLRAIDGLKSRIKFRLNICGTVTDSSIEEEYDNLILQNKDVVVQHGYVDNQRKYEILTKTDILILPSYHEGFPLVILEALATGCAIVSTSVGAIPEVLSKDNYISITSGSISSICEAILFLDSQRDLLNEIKENNLKKSELFGFGAHLENLIKIYQSAE